MSLSCHSELFPDVDFVGVTRRRLLIKKDAIGPLLVLASLGRAQLRKGTAYIHPCAGFCSRGF